MHCLSGCQVENHLNNAINTPDLQIRNNVFFHNFLINQDLMLYMDVFFVILLCLYCVFFMSHLCLFSSFLCLFYVFLMLFYVFYTCEHRL